MESASGKDMGNSPRRKDSTMQEAERSSETPRYNEDAVNHLIEAATGAGRILNVMACDAEEEDYAQSAAYRVLADRLWRAVEGVSGCNPMEIGRN